MILDIKAKRIIKVTDTERTCLNERRRQQAKREWVKENIIEWLGTYEDGMVINFRL